MKLSDAAVRNAKANGKVQKLSDGGGLYLHVTATGSKLWRMAYRFEGKQKLLSFGAYPAVSLKDARHRRDDARESLAKGIVPVRKKNRPERPYSQKSGKNGTPLNWWRGSGSPSTSRRSPKNTPKNYVAILKIRFSRPLAGNLSPSLNLPTFCRSFSPRSVSAITKQPTSSCACADR